MAEVVGQERARCLVGLPPACTEALALDAEMVSRSGRVWIEQARSFLGDRPVHHLARTATRVDVGAWIGRVRLWCFATADSLLLGAWGGLSPASQPYEEVVPYRDLRSWTYNAVRGELLLGGHGLRHWPGLRVKPLDGYQFLAQIEKGLS